MMALVIGGSGSGKSAYAERLAVSLAEADATSCQADDGAHRRMRKYYLATMQICDREGQRKADRHRRLRSGKGFCTIEQPSNLSGALLGMEEGGRVVLLECISNLTANEMFSAGGVCSEVRTAEHVIRDIGRLREETTHLIVVSNNVFEDGNVYDEATMAYIRAMGRINGQLAVWADRVVEVVAGIPVILKAQGGGRYAGD